MKRKSQSRQHREGKRLTFNFETATYGRDLHGTLGTREEKELRLVAMLVASVCVAVAGGMGLVGRFWVPISQSHLGRTLKLS